MSRWWRRSTAIKSIIAEATPHEKQEILADADLVERLKSKLSHSDMPKVFSLLNAPLREHLEILLKWGGYAAAVVSLISQASSLEKEEIANHAGLMIHIMTTFRDDYKQQVVSQLNLLATEMFTNNPNNGSIGFTSLMVLSQDKLTIEKVVNFRAAGTFMYDQAGFERLKERFIAAVSTYLSGKFAVRIESLGDTEQDAPADGEYPIIVRLGHNLDANYLLYLHGGIHGRGGVTKLRGHIYELGEEQEGETRVPDIYLAHEGAHLILGADDEYDYTWLPQTNIYQDNSLMGNFYQEGIALAKIKKRHFQFLVPLLSRWFPERTISIIAKEPAGIK